MGWAHVISRGRHTCCQGQHQPRGADPPNSQNQGFAARRGEGEDRAKARADCRLHQQGAAAALEADTGTSAGHFQQTGYHRCSAEAATSANVHAPYGHGTWWNGSGPSGSNDDGPTAFDEGATTSNGTPCLPSTSNATVYAALGRSRWSASAAPQAPYGYGHGRWPRSQAPTHGGHSHARGWIPCYPQESCPVQGKLKKIDNLVSYKIFFKQVYLHMTQQVFIIVTNTKNSTYC